MSKEKQGETLQAKQPMNPILIIAIILVIVAVLTYLIPTGSFDRAYSSAALYRRLPGPGKNTSRCFRYSTLSSSVPALTRW